MTGGCKHCGHSALHTHPPLPTNITAKRPGLCLKCLSCQLAAPEPPNVKVPTNE